VKKRTIEALPYAQDGWNGWMESAWMDFAPLQQPDSWLTPQNGKTILDLPCRRVLRLETPRGAVYAKIMRAGNDGVIKNREWWGLLRWMLLPSRGVHIFHMHQRMLAMGHGCAEPVLGARHRGPWGYPHELFISREVPHDTLEALFPKLDAIQLETCLRCCAVQLAAFHADGFVHGDCIKRNLCYDMAEEQLYFLDNDRTKRWRNKAPFFLQRRNLAQFCYSLVRDGAEADLTLPTCFLEAYGGQAGWSSRRLEDEKDRIFPPVLKRWRQRQKHCKH
jgi:hypothetical protein